MERRFGDGFGPTYDFLLLVEGESGAAQIWVEKGNWRAFGVSK
jgi:hypothetical protein